MIRLDDVPISVHTYVRTYRQIPFTTVVCLNIFDDATRFAGGGGRVRYVLSHELSMTVDLFSLLYYHYY